MSDPVSEPTSEEPASEPVEPSRSNATPASPRLEPVQIDTGRIIAVGTLAFVLALVGLVVARLAGADWAAHHSTWLWTCLAGAVLGAMGLVIVGRHRRLGRTK